MRGRAKKQKRLPVGFIRGLTILALVTLALKLFLQSPVAQSLENMISDAAGEGSLAAAALCFELGVPASAAAEAAPDTQGGSPTPFLPLPALGQAEAEGRDGDEPVEEEYQEPDASQVPEETEPLPALQYDPSLITLTNHTSMDIDVAAYLDKALSLQLSEDGPSVLIIHTHTSEAYTATPQYSYTPSDPYRTENPRYSVVRVGDVVEKRLQEAGIEVVHDTTLYDYPSYTGSYNRALRAIEGYLAEYPTISVVLDIHRDSVQEADGTQRTSWATVGGEKCAQVMLVVGTGEGGLNHPKWEENFRFALELQTVMANRYPGLARSIDLRTERFNAHATTGSLLVEIGYSGNTLEEALSAAEYFSRSLVETLSEKK